MRGSREPTERSVHRREVLALMAATTAVSLSWPDATLAQTNTRRIGLLSAAYNEQDQPWKARIKILLAGLEKLGWTEGRNIHFEYRWAGGDRARIKAFAAELVKSAPDAIVAVGDVALAELHDLGGTIPIVFTQVSDPVESGVVAGLARPGGTVTGFQNFEQAIGGKWIGVLKETAPNLRRVAVLFDRSIANNMMFMRATQEVAPAAGLALTAIDVAETDIEPAIASFGSEPGGGLIVFPHPRLIAIRKSIIDLAARHRLPAIYPYRYFATDGGLVAYGPDQLAQWRGAAIYLDRVLRGEKPSNLPVQTPTKYELVVNLKTAKALGNDVPPALLVRADDVIE